MRPSTQWCYGPHGGDGGVWHGSTAEFTQHEVGRYNPCGGGGDVACAQCCWSPWWRVARIAGVVRLSAWVLAGSEIGRGCPGGVLSRGEDGLLCVGPL
jgi:hypothetical protein